VFCRLALESFRNHRKRIFPAMPITPPDLAPVPPKKPRLAEAAPEGAPAEKQSDIDTTPPDASNSGTGAHVQAQGPDQEQGQPPVEGSEGGVWEWEWGRL